MCIYKCKSTNLTVKVSIHVFMLLLQPCSCGWVLAPPVHVLNKWYVSDMPPSPDSLYLCPFALFTTI